MPPLKTYNVIGLMSGTSLDGLDLCYASFSQVNEKWDYEIHATQTVEYPVELRKKLALATKLSGEQLFLLDNSLGKFMGNTINEFIGLFSIDRKEVDAVCSHGHTVFHQPNKGLTVQIGCGATIAHQTKIRTINDFRKRDVLHGGQGAPLVPIGDLLLFSNYADSFLNIGGFANFSKIEKGQIAIASDICPVNNLLNYYCQQLGVAYDKNGEIARNAKIHTDLLQQLNASFLYKQMKRPSLGWEWVERELVPLIDRFTGSIEQKIATITRHAVDQIVDQLHKHACQKVFVTGGGAKNSFLTKTIRQRFSGDIIVAQEQLIDFKEALIFGLLGVLFLENRPNCLPIVTGASKAVMGGQLFLV